MPRPKMLLKLANWVVKCAGGGWIYYMNLIAADRLFLQASVLPKILHLAHTVYTSACHNMAPPAFSDIAKSSNDVSIPISGQVRAQAADASFSY